MQWFKHDSNTTMDFKIKKLIIKYGAVGYAIYFHCLELIAGSINENNITFELEHDSEIIADDLRISGTSDKSGKELVEEIMRYMVQLNLFEENNGHIFCFKLLKRLDTSMTSNTKLRNLITKAKNQEQFLDFQEENHDGVMMNHDYIMQDKTRLDNTRLKKTIQEKNKNSCSEQSDCSEPAELRDSTICLILNDNSEWCPSKAEIAEFTKLYPNVDVITELRKMRGWCIGNPKKRKTRYGIKRFVTSWLGKEQDKPSFVKNNKQNEKPQQYTDEEYRAMSDDVSNLAF